MHASTAPADLPDSPAVIINYAITAAIALFAGVMLGIALAASPQADRANGGARAHAAAGSGIHGRLLP